MITITAGYYLISTTEISEETNPLEVQSFTEQHEQPGISEAGRNAEKILQQKCTICHNLERIKKADKAKSQWIATIERMVGYTNNPRHLSKAEKIHLINMLISGGDK